MNQYEIFHGLWTITKEKYTACKAEVDAMGKEHPTEKSALQLKAGIYNVAIAAGLISGSDQATKLMSRRFGNLVKQFPDLVAYYNGLSEEERGIMEIALYPEMFMRVNFYNTYHSELALAEKNGDPQLIFKARLKKEVLDDILNMWRTFRVQNHLFAFAFEDKEG